MSKPELCGCGHDKDNHILGKEPWRNGCTIMLVPQAVTATLTVGEPCECLGYNPVVRA